MPRLLHKIAKPEEDMKRFNDNFDRISLDIADRSGVFSSVATVPGGFTVAASSVTAIELNVKDSKNLFVLNKLPFIPRVNLYIENDLDDTYRYPHGANVTDQNLIDITVTVYNQLSAFDIEENEKATASIIVKNGSLNPIDFFVYIDCFYVPAPDEGVAIRND